MTVAQVTRNKRVNKILLPSLTALRGPAAFFVFLYHIGHNTQWLRPVGVFTVGYAGVSLFFVLSGFVLTWSFAQERGFADFYRRRFARVYPLHFFFLLVALVVPVLAVSRSVPAFWANLFLVQAWFPSWDVIFSFNAVSWSLSCEAFFYAVAPFIFVRALRGSARGGALVLVAVAAAIAVGAVVCASSSNTMDVIVYANPFFRSAEFLLGIAAALLVKERYGRLSGSPAVPRRQLVMACVGSLTLVVFALLVLSRLSWGQTVTGFVLAPLFTVMIVAFAVFDIESVKAHTGTSGRIQRVMVYLGEISFAFYLCHELVIVNMAKIFAFHAGVKGGVMVLATFLLSLGIASAAHHLVEKPMQRTIMKR